MVLLFGIAAGPYEDYLVIPCLLDESHARFVPSERILGIKTKTGASYRSDAPVDSGFFTPGGLRNFFQQDF